MNFRSLLPTSSTKRLLTQSLSCRSYQRTLFPATQRLGIGASMVMNNASNGTNHIIPTLHYQSFSSQSQTANASNDTEDEPEYLLSKGRVPLFDDPTKLSNDLINDIGINLEIDWTDWKAIRKEYSKVLPYYINDFITYIAARTSDPVIRNEILRRIQNMLYKTGIGGKNNRGILAITSLFHLKEFVINQQKRDNNDNIIRTNENKEMNEKEYKFYQKYGLTVNDLHNAFTVACAIESLQSYFLVLDDIMDNSLTRRGQPCWYRMPNVGIKAINDAPIIESFVFWLINQRVIDFTPKFTILPQFDHLRRKDATNNDYIPNNEVLKPGHVYLLDKIFQETKLQTLLGLFYMYLYLYPFAKYSCGWYKPTIFLFCETSRNF